MLPISIHAPAKGATALLGCNPQSVRISIHAPAKGATQIWTQQRHRTVYFNPRSREGSDPVRCLRFLMLHYFNPRSREGSDTGRRRLPRPDRHFNPRSREGSDANRDYYTTKLDAFQSTLPRRERRTLTAPLIPNVDFNPRSREGSDVSPCCLLSNKKEISIHAPAKGATRFRLQFLQLNSISIHAPAKGATDFIRAIITRFTLFQSTLPRRERRTISRKVCYSVGISIHAPEKGATFL